MESGPTESPQAARSGWRLFHLVTSQSPLAADFRSLLAQGKLPKYGLDRPETFLQAAGVSCYETPEQARSLARRVPELGAFIAEVFIPDDGCAIEVVRTGRGGHYTVWASPAYFVSRVVSIVPV